jgi:hypothetical protein
VREGLRIESRISSDGRPSAMCIWVTQVREWMEGDGEWNTENPIKSNETTGYFAPRATCSATTQLL